MESTKADLIETEGRMVASRAWWVGEMKRYGLKGMNFQLYDEEFLEI